MLCHGNATGAAAISVSGGTTPYSYTWTNNVSNSASATNIAAGNYTVSVTDANQCTASVAITITEPAADLTASEIADSHVDVLCHGNATGAAAISVSGGTTPYSYTWTNSVSTTASATDIAAGEYTVSVTDANQCTTSVAITITQPTAVLAASITSQTNVNCYGDNTGSITVTATENTGTAPYTYTRRSVNNFTSDNTFNNLSAGKDTIIVKDNNGCTVEVPFEITQPTAALAANEIADSHVDVLCHGNATGAAAISVSGGTTPYSYTWTNNVSNSASATNIAAGNYTVSVTDANQCTASVAITITEPTTDLAASITSQTNVNCYGDNTGSITVTATENSGTAPYTYTRRSVNNFTSNSTFTGLSAGKDTIIVKDYNGCTVEVPFEITQPEELILTEASHVDVACYGNATGEITVSAAGGVPTYLYKWDNGNYGGAEHKDGLTAGEHTIVVRDANHCTATLTVEIAQPEAALSATLKPTDVSCYGYNDGAIDVTVQGGTPTYSFTWNDQIHAEDRTELTAGTYTVTITDAHYCTLVESVTLEQPAEFTVAISSGEEEEEEIEICANETVTFTAETTGSIASLQWQKDGENIENATSSTLSNINTAGSYTVVATQTTSGCTVTSEAITLTVDTVPNVTITGPTSVCDGNEFELIAHNAYHYVWSDGTDPIEPEEEDVLIANGEDIEGSTTYHVTGTNSYGCTASASHTVTVNTLPDATMTFTLNNETVTPNNNSEIDFCADGTLTLSVPNVEGSTYTWYGADELLEEDGHSLTLTNATPEQTGWYRVEITDANGCTNETSSTLIVANPLPNVVLSEDHNLNTICADSAFHFTVTCEACTTAVSSYVWKYNDVTITGASTSTLRATEGGTYVVTATDENGCVKTTNALPVTVNALPTVTLSEENDLTTICADSAFHFVATCQTEVSYSWQRNNGLMDGHNSTLRATMGGDYVVTVTDENGCSNSSNTMTVTVNPLPEFTISTGNNSDAAICSDGTLNMTAEATATYNYTWDGDYVTVNQETTSLAIFSHAADANATYTVSVTATDNNNCTKTLTKEVTVYALPVVTVNDPTLCLNGTTALTAEGATTYTWTPATYLNASTGAGVTFTGSVAGNFDIVVTGTDDHNCSSTDTATVTVLNLPTTGLTLENKEICQGATASWTIAEGNYDSYAWSSSLDGSLGDNTTGNSITFTGSTTGTHSVTVEVTDANGCTNSASANVIVDTLPVITLSSETAVCQNGDIIFTTTAATADNGIHGYVWTYPTANATVTGETDGNTLTVKWSDYGNKTVKVNYTDGHNCTATQPASKTISVNELPNVIITNGEAATICLGETVNLNADGATTYEWANNAGNTAAITVEPKRDSTFTVTGTDANGCSNTASIDFTVNDTVKLTISNNSQEICLGGAIEEIAITYEAATLNTITYCDGLSYDSETGKVTGTPTAAGTYNYTITATSDETPSCGSKSENITIVVNDTVKFNATDLSQELCLGASITPIVLDTAHCTLNFGEMPDELSYNETSHQIEGRLTEAGTYNFTVTATNGCNTKTKDVSITVNDTVSLTVTPATQTLCLGTPITTIEIEAENGTVTFINLPAELSANSDHTAITGELTTAGTHTFTITASSTTCPSTDKSVEVSITMLDTAKLTATHTTQTLCLGTPIQPIVLDTAHCTLDFDEMPDGLSYNATTHQIEGQLTEADEYEFTITATNGCGTKTQDVSITVNDTVSLTVTPATQTLCLGTPITTIEIEAENGTVSFVGLPTGLSANSDNSAITGELTTAGTHTFTIKATSTSCSSSDKQQTVSITMNDTVKLVALSRADDFSQEFCKGIAMTDLNFRITNSDNVELTGAPAGVTLAAVEAESETEPNYVMSGTPTATGTFNFTITASSEACEASVKTFNGTIIVDTIPAVAITTNADNNTICADEAITMTATAGYTSYSWSNQATSSSIEIVPSADATEYTVTVTNGEGCSNTDTINITINELPTVTISEENSLSTICADSAFHFIVNCTTAVEYLWSDESDGSTLRATEAGEYFVAVTDANGCTNESNTLTVTVNPLPEVTTSHENVSCTELGSAIITVTSEGTGFTCAWNNAQTATLTEQNDDELYFITFGELNGGDYPFIITDSKGCSKKDTVTIDNPGSISATQSIANAYSCEGTDNTVTFSIDGGTADYTIQWVDVESELIVADTIVTGTENVTFNMDDLARGDYRLAMVITDNYGCTGNATDTIDLTVWPSYDIVREINIVQGENEYNYHGVDYTYPAKPDDEHLTTVYGCDSIISYVVTPYSLQILVADTCYLTRSSYTRPYSNTPENLIDTLYVKKNTPAWFYAYISDTDDDEWNEEKMDMSYELLYNEESINNDDMPNLVSNFSISSYYDRTGQFYGINNLTESTGEIPSNTLAFRQTANSTILQFDYFYFAAFKNIPNKVNFTGLENGTYTLKLKAELRIYDPNAEEEDLGTNRNGIYNPYIVGRKYGHVWGGYGDMPIDREVIAARTFTIIVNEDGEAPSDAPAAINEYGNEASVSTYPNPVNDQLNLRISGMSGQTVITITDAQGKVVRTLNAELTGSEETLTYSVADFAQGMYFLNVRNNDTLVSQKFVVTRR